MGKIRNAVFYLELMVGWGHLGDTGYLFGRIVDLEIPRKSWTGSNWLVT
jgi:hypothetical protein